MNEAASSINLAIANLKQVPGIKDVVTDILLFFPTRFLIFQVTGEQVVEAH
jgi:hypothetical protein